jgi:hypothetical protein
MTGPDHYRKAEELTAKAHDYLGQGEGLRAATGQAGRKAACIMCRRLYGIVGAVRIAARGRVG